MCRQASVVKALVFIRFALQSTVFKKGILP